MKKRFCDLCETEIKESYFEITVCEIEKPFFYKKVKKNILIYVIIVIQKSLKEMKKRVISLTLFIFVLF